MKIGRTEKIWLASVLFFWVFYNFPGFPPYGSETACIIHGLISFVGTVLSVYIEKTGVFLYKLSVSAEYCCGNCRIVQL